MLVSNLCLGHMHLKEVLKVEDFKHYFQISRKVVAVLLCWMIISLILHINFSMVLIQLMEQVGMETPLIWLIILLIMPKIVYKIYNDSMKKINFWRIIKILYKMKKLYTYFRIKINE